MSSNMPSHLEFCPDSFDPQGGQSKESSNIIIIHDQQTTTLQEGGAETEGQATDPLPSNDLQDAGRSSAPW